MKKTCTKYQPIFGQRPSHCFVTKNVLKSNFPDTELQNITLPQHLTVLCCRASVKIFRELWRREPCGREAYERERESRIEGKFKFSSGSESLGEKIASLTRTRTANWPSSIVSYRLKGFSKANFDLNQTATSFRIEGLHRKIWEKWIRKCENDNMIR